MREGKFFEPIKVIFVLHPNREPNDIDVAAVYHQLADVYHSSESENDNESDVGPSTSTPSTTAAAGTPTARVRGNMSTAARRLVN